jgi:hypothetical protein
MKMNMNRDMDMGTDMKNYMDTEREADMDKAMEMDMKIAKDTFSKIGILDIGKSLILYRMLQYHD